MYVIAITGGIGSGKSAVADHFRKKGIPIVDTDKISRDIILQSDVLEQIRNNISQDVFKQDGTLDRAKLRKLVFTMPEKREKLNQIIHPRIFEEVQNQISHSVSPYVIVVIPLLYESRLPYKYNRVLVVDADPEIQIERASQRDNLPQEEIRQILSAQATREQRLSIADDVIDNSNGLSQLYKQVDVLHDKYLQLSAKSG